MECKTFDPDGVGVDNGTYFGLPFDPATAELVLVSAPWDVTVSYGAGAAYAPRCNHRSLDAARFPRSAGSGRMAPGNRHGRRGLLAAGGVAAAADRCGAGDRPPRGRRFARRRVRRAQGAPRERGLRGHERQYRVAGGALARRRPDRGPRGRRPFDPLRTDPGARGAPRRVRHSSYRRPLRPARRLRRVRIFARLDHVQRAARRAAGGADRPGRGARFQRGGGRAGRLVGAHCDLRRPLARRGPFPGETWTTSAGGSSGRCPGRCTSASTSTA